MNLSSHHWPQTDETLAQYVRRVRTELGLSQEALAARAGIHSQSLVRIETGKTTRLSQKTKEGLSQALRISNDCLEAVCRGVPLPDVQALKICPACWQPGTEADPMWLDARAQYCYLCGELLRDRCTNCQAEIPSLQFRFCPYCGKSYKDELEPERQ